MIKLIRSQGRAMALLILICLLFAQGCKKDNQIPTRLDAQTANARSWYQKNMANANNILKSDKGDYVTVTVKPKWLNMVPVGLDEQSEAFVIPLQTDIPEKFSKKFIPVLVIEKTGDSYRSMVTNAIDIPMEGNGIDKNTAGKAIYKKAFGIDRGPTGEEGIDGDDAPANNTRGGYTGINKGLNKVMGRPQDPITPAPTCTDWYWVTTYFDDAGTVIDQTVKFAFQTCLMEGGGGEASGGDFGVDPNCSNCVIQNDKFSAFLEYAASLGVTATTPFHTILKVNGAEYQGTITELYDQQGKFIIAYFTPDSSSSLFQVGSSYSIGNKGADGTSNSGSNVVTNVYFGNPYYSGGSQYTGGGAVTYYSANAQLLINSLGLNTFESAFLNGNTQLANMIKTYLDTNGWTPNNKEFGKWAIGYLVENPGSFNQAFRDLLNGVYNENSPIYIPNNFDIAYPQEYFDTEDSYDALTLELVQEGISNTDPIPESYYKNGTKIDMAPATPLNGRRTALGFPSNHRYFWKELIKLRPEMFDTENRTLILDGKSPVANDQWIKYNPTHKFYRNLPLRHHHEGQGRWAYAIPEKVHQKWSNILHSIKAGKFPKLKGTMNALAGGMQIFSLLTDFNTGNPDAWLNWYGPVDQVGKVYKQPFSGDYFVITKQTKYMNSSGEVIRAKVTYDVFADYIWDADEHKYMGVLKLGTFTELVDMNNRWSTDQVWEPKTL